MVLITDILILMVLLALSGFFSGAEVALISLSKHKCKNLVEKNKFGSKYVEKLKNDTQRMLATILIGNNVVNVAASAIATSIAINTFQNFAIGIATGIMTFLILIFGEITPKTIAEQHNEISSQLVAAPIWYLSVILAPIVQILNKFLIVFMALFGIKAKQDTTSEEEIITMVKTAEEEGTIKEIEKKMINSIFEFDDLNAEEIATPKADMVAIESKCKIKDAIKLVLKKNHSRIPVYEKSRDHIRGIIYAKDLMEYMKNKKENLSIKKIMKEPYFVPETKKVSSLLKHFQKRKEHMAIVVDEHGSVTGLVTLEDVLEEIVGEIMDETDKVDPNIRKTGKNVWSVKGKTDIEEVNEKLKMKLKGEGYDTLSGFILKFTGKIPKVNEEITHNKFKFKIEELSGNRISQVKVEKGNFK